MEVVVRIYRYVSFIHGQRRQRALVDITLRCIKLLSKSSCEMSLAVSDSLVRRLRTFAIFRSFYDSLVRPCQGNDVVFVRHFKNYLKSTS